MGNHFLGQSIGLSPLKLQEAKMQINNYLENEWIEPVSSSCVSLILFFKKKDEALRMVVNWHAPNKHMIKNHHPLSHIDDLFDQLPLASIFPSLDLTQ